MDSGQVRAMARKIMFQTALVIKTRITNDKMMSPERANTELNVIKTQ